MDDDRPAVPSFYVDDSPEPLSYFASDEEAQDQCPDIPIPTTGRGAVAPPVGSQLGGEEAVHAVPSVVPQLRRRRTLRNRTLSAPTLMEHEIGLALRNISDEFNEAYVQQQANQRRRASLPNMDNNMNNHHSNGFRSWWHQISRNSRTSSSVSSDNTAPEVSGLQGSMEPSQRLSVNSIPEEDEEAVERESN